MLIDTHAHIHLKQFDYDRDDVIKRAIDNNLCGIIEIGIDVESSKKCIKLAQENDIIYSACGVHPHDSSDVSPEFLFELEKIINKKRSLH